MKNASLPGEAIRITAEPWRPQEVSNKAYNTIANELTRRTRRQFRYVPSTSYMHAQHLVSAGMVDVLVSGSYGAYLAFTKNPEVRIIAVESQAARSALIMNGEEASSRTTKGSVEGIRRIRRQRVGFGSRYAGLETSSPLLEMAKHGIKAKEMDTCTYIADQELRKRNIINGELDYAFVRLKRGEERHGFADEDRIKVAWLSPAQQDFIVSIGNRMLSPQNRQLRRDLTDLLISLDDSKPSDQIILRNLDIEKIEKPTPFYPGQAFATLKRSEHDVLALAREKCE